MIVIYNCDEVIVQATVVKQTRLKLINLEDVSDSSRMSNVLVIRRSGKLTKRLRAVFCVTSNLITVRPSVLQEKKIIFCHFK